MKFNKIISVLLIVSFLVSALSIFSFATEGEGISEDITVLYNRTFDEGWAYSNGLTTSQIKSHKFSVDYEEDELRNYNYFLRAEAGTTTAGYLYFNFAGGGHTPLSGGTVIELSIKADDICDMGAIVTGYTRRSDYVQLLHINERNELIAFNTISESNAASTCAHANVENGYCLDCANCTHTDTREMGYYKQCVGCGANFAVNLGTLEDEWIDIAFIFNWGEQGDSSDFKCTLKWGENYENAINVQFGYEDLGDKAISQLRFNIPAGSTDDYIGKGYCIDNLKIYQNQKAAIEDVLDIGTDCGLRVNSNAAKPITILEGANVKTPEQILEEALCMKVGVNHALMANEKIEIFEGGKYGAPVIIDGTVMIPLELLLEYIGYPYYQHADGQSYDITTGSSVTNITLGRDSASVDGKRVGLSAAPGVVTVGEDKYTVIALEDVEQLFAGLITVYDNMGLIIIHEDVTPDDLTDNDDAIVNRTDDLELMLDVMKKFVFDVSEETKLKDAYNDTGKSVYEDAKSYTDSFTHPYILADQSIFDTLKSAYNGSDEVLKNYIGEIVARADEQFKLYATTSGSSYTGIHADKLPVNVYNDGLNPDTNDSSDTTVADTIDGYDPVEGRVAALITYTEFLPTMAFAYQVTGNNKYAEFAYDWMVELAGWIHWGPGYFTDCAEATASYAIAYDWLYNAFKSLGKDTDVLAEAIYSLGVHDGFVSANGQICEHARSLGDKSGYVTLPTSSNAVSSAGMIIGSLAIFDYLSAEGREEAYNEAIYLVGNNIINLATYGLDQYAPDGAYIESATYWNVGTNSFFKLVMALMSSTGSDYGFMNTWGIDKTCYYAIHIENSDGYIWNYHDGGADGVTSGELGTMDTSMFNFVGAFFGDANLIATRQQQLNDKKPGKVISIYDLLYYPTEMPEKYEPELSYRMDGVEGYVVRSDWNKGAMYVGLMGGYNNFEHGQLDSGNFIFQKYGIQWFMDLGTENPLAYNYFGETRYKYYRANAEGQNVVVIEGNDIVLDYGQYADASGKLTKTYENEHGNYAILENAEVYNGNANNYLRGILVTNDGNTVVVQDELDCEVNVKMVYWVAHSASNAIWIDDSGKNAYITATNADGDTYVLRASLVTPGTYSELKFETQSVNDPILQGITYGKNDSINQGGAPEYARDGISRLIIHSTTTMSLKVAVVLEFVSDVGDASNIGYSWSLMNGWNPSAAEENDGTSSGATATLRGAGNEVDISSSTTTASNILDRDGAFTEYLPRLFSALTTVQYTLNYFGYTSKTIPTAYVDSFKTYNKIMKAYDDYAEYVNGNADDVKNIVAILAGSEPVIVPPVVEEGAE